MQTYAFESPLLRVARGLSRRSFLGRIGGGAATIVGAAALRLSLPTPPVFAQATCTICTGSCSSCASFVLEGDCHSPDGSCGCSQSCVCQSWEQKLIPCNPFSEYAYALCCNGCYPPTTESCNSCG